MSRAPLVPPTLHFLETTSDGKIFTDDFYRYTPQEPLYNTLFTLMGAPVLRILLRSESGREFTQLIPYREDRQYVGATCKVDGEPCTVLTASFADPYEELLEKIGNTPCSSCLVGVVFCRDWKTHGTYELTGTILAQIPHIYARRKKKPCTCGMKVLRRLTHIAVKLQAGVEMWW